MENTNEFEIENEETVQGTDTTSTAVAVKAVEFTLPALPEIPEVLNINGVEFSEKILREKVDNIKTMKIKDFLDDEGYEKAKKELSLLTKTRTGSEKWRAAVVKPVNDLAKRLKAKVDSGNVIVAEGETYLKSIMTPYENYKEEERQRQEKEKDDRLAVRAKLLIDAGMIYNGAGTYNSPLDPAIFVVADEMREFSEELWNETYNPIKSLFDQEEKRKSDEAQQKEQQTNQLASQVADLNEERTEMRKELLEAKGFEKLTKGWFNHVNNIIISEEQVLSANKDEWKELLNPTPKVEDKPVDTYSGGPSLSAPAPTPAVSSIANDFEVEEETPAVAEVGHEIIPDNSTDELNGLDITLGFSKSEPFIDFAISENYKVRLFNVRAMEKAIEGIPEKNIFVDTVFGNLNFALIKTKED